MKTGIELIADERQRQIDNENYTLEHDLQYSEGELARAAACYAMTSEERKKYQSLDVVNYRWFPRWWPWSASFWKPTPEDRIKELVKAGALVAAEIDRLNNYSGCSDSIFENGLSDSEKSIIVDAVNLYFHHAHNILQKPNLGDVEVRVWTNIKDKCSKIIERKR